LSNEGRLLGVIAFRVEGKRAFQIVRLCSSKEDGADTQEDGGNLHDFDFVAERENG
jgi:hypothetical protein